MIVVSREHAGLSRTTVELTNERELLPPLADSLDGVDTLVLASDHTLDDSAGMAAMRRWLHQGGRLWIPVDRVRREIVDALIGHAACYEEVDRVELSQFAVDDVTAPAGLPHTDEREFERPVVLVRVLTGRNGRPLAGSAVGPQRSGCRSAKARYSSPR